MSENVTQIRPDYDESCIGKDPDYYRRSEKHGISAFDCHQIIKFSSF